MRKATQYNLFLITLLLGVYLSAHSQSRKTGSNIFRAAFYNVENLFDTIDDPLKDDAEFTPAGRIPWTTDRYLLKLDHLSQVIAALSDPNPPAIIGLCEVENRKVLEELVASPEILPYQYQVIHLESPDERGIDNAMLYDPKQFRPIVIKAIQVDLSTTNGDFTRDILYVKGLAVKSRGDTLHLFINHWPSRSEGREISEPKRMLAATSLKNATDSLIKNPEKPLIVILGDFNDEPSDKSLSEVLGALAPADQKEPGKLYNLAYKPYLEGQGTLYWKDWDLFDQFIVSGTFYERKKGLTCRDDRQGIFNPDWLMYKDNEGKMRPNRTAAKDYYGGYSDHLPVYIDLEIKK